MFVKTGFQDRRNPNYTYKKGKEMVTWLISQLHLCKYSTVDGDAPTCASVTEFGRAECRIAPRNIDVEPNRNPVLLDWLQGMSLPHTTMRNTSLGPKADALFLSSFAEKTIVCVNYFGQLSPFRVLFQGLLYCVKSSAALNKKTLCAQCYLCALFQ